MRGAIPSLPQYVFMAWYLVKKSTGTTLPFTFYYMPTVDYERDELIQKANFAAKSLTSAHMRGKTLEAIAPVNSSQPVTSPNKSPTAHNCVD
jgi:hypothetical protein